jgi:hypothetical protein
MKQFSFFIIFILCYTLTSAATWIGGNGDWSVASNWDTGQVPDDDTAVLISGGIVEISGQALARTLNILSGGSLNIRGAGSLLIKNANPADAPFLTVRGVLNNDGLIQINNSATNSNNIPKLALYNPGTLNNAGTIIISQGEGLGMSIGAQTTVVNTASGKLSITEGWTGLVQLGSCVNYGKLTISKMTSSGLDAYADMVNHGDISMDDIDAEGLLVGNSTFTNNGEIRISDAFLALQIAFSGSFINEAASELRLLDTDNIALFHIGNELRNYGLISIVDAHSGIITSSSAQSVTNYASGTMTIRQVQSLGISNGALFKNFGDISVQNVTNGTGLNNNGNFRNLGNGYFSIENVLDVGINNFSNGLIVNQALIEIDHVDGIGIFNNGNSSTPVFRNRFGGLLSLSDIQGTGILNSAYLHNKNGEITFAASPNADYDIDNTGDILNERCATITLRQALEHTAGVIDNDAWMIAEFDDATGHIVLAPFNNNGVIQDEFGAFDVNDIQNNGVILNPIPGNQFVNTPVSNALDLGSLSNTTINGWWTDDSGTTSAGVYDAVNNTFTPNLQAQWATVLYVELSHNLGLNCSRLLLPVHFEYPILPPPPFAPVEEQSSGIQAFPNPSNGHVELRIPDASFSDGRISLLNMFGQPVRIELPAVQGPGACQLDLSHLQAGTYWLQLVADDGTRHSIAVVIQ